MYKKIYFLLFLLASLPVFGQKRATITGFVYDFDNKPMDFVSVSHKGSIIGTFTDSKGAYSITVPVGDSVTIVFSCMGYLKTQRVIPKMTANMRLNVMMRENANALGEVVVTGRQKQTSTMQKVDAGNVKLLADPSGGSIESIIVTLAGVSSTNELSSQYSVRGGSYDENIVYVNGIEVNRPLLIRSGQQEGLSFINPNLTGSVGFSAGGYDASYGDKMSSVLDIGYRKPENFEASVSGSFLGGNMHVGTAGKRFTQITGIRYKTNKSLVGTMDTKAEYDPYFVDAQTYMTYALAPRWEASFLGNYSKNVYRFRPINQSTSFGTLTDVRNFTVYFDGWEKDKFETAFGALSLKGKLSDKLDLSLTASAFSSYEHVNYDVSGEYWLSEQEIDTQKGTTQEGELLGVGAYLEHARNNLEMKVRKFTFGGSYNAGKLVSKWGLTWQNESIDDKIKEWQLRDSSGYSIPNSGELVKVYSNLQSNNNLSSTRLAAYVLETYKFRIQDGLFTLNAGIRASHWSFNKETIVSPRASLAYVPNKEKDITLRMAVGVYYQAPFYKEFRETILDPNGDSHIALNKDIKSQKSIHFVIGGDYEFKTMDRPFKFTTEMYYKKLSNLVPYTVDNVKITYYGKNMASGHIAGLDMKLFGEFVPGTDSWISFSLMKSQQDINGLKVPLPTDQSYNFSLYFQDYVPGHKRLKMNMRGLFSQGLPTTPSNQGYNKGIFRMPAYRRVDIGFSWQALGEEDAIRQRNSFVKGFKNIWLGLDVFNLLDIKNTNSYYWISDVYNNQFAVPNYLTGRQLNLRFIAEF
jgi:hypothetical protein